MKPMELPALSSSHQLMKVSIIKVSQWLQVKIIIRRSPIGRVDVMTSDKTFCLLLPSLDADITGHQS